MVRSDIQRRPARRKEIVEAARAMAAEEGWQAVSVRRLAARVGCSAAAIYQYLPDKNAILRAIAENGERDLATRLLSVDGGPAKRLRGAAQAYLDFALEAPEIYHVIHGLDGTPRLGAPPLGGDVARVLVDLSATLLAKHCRDEPAEELAACLQAMLHGHAAVALTAQPPDRAEAGRLLALAVDDTLRGVACR